MTNRFVVSEAITNLKIYSTGAVSGSFAISIGFSSFFFDGIPTTMSAKPLTRRIEPKPFAVSFARSRTF